MTSVLINIRQREIELKKTKQSKTEAEIDVMWPQNKNTCNHQKLEEARNRSSTRIFRRNQACKTFFFF